jgi:hypothetical protein
MRPSSLATSVQHGYYGRVNGAHQGNLSFTGGRNLRERSFRDGIQMQT